MNNELFNTLIEQGSFPFWRSNSKSPIEKHYENRKRIYSLLNSSKQSNEIKITFESRLKK